MKYWGALPYILSIKLDKNTLDPNAMIGIDFDNSNLEYKLVSSTFYSYKNREYYTYNTNSDRDLEICERRNNSINSPCRNITTTIHLLLVRRSMVN